MEAHYVEGQDKLISFTVTAAIPRVTALGAIRQIGRFSAGAWQLPQLFSFDEKAYPIITRTRDSITAIVKTNALTRR